MAHLPLSTFRRCVARYRGERKVESVSCLDRFPAMAFALPDRPVAHRCALSKRARLRGTGGFTPSATRTRLGAPVDEVHGVGIQLVWPFQGERWVDAGAPPRREPGGRAPLPRSSPGCRRFRRIRDDRGLNWPDKRVTWRRLCRFRQPPPETAGLRPLRILVQHADALPAPLRAERLAAQVARLLRVAIGEGRWSPGARLPAERVLAAELDVSRAVLREAMAVLRHEGVVVSRQGAGVFVSATPTAATPFAATEQTVLDHLELRRALEVEATALAASRCPPEGLARIRAARDALNRKIDEGVESVEEGFAFHRSIVAASGNRELLRMLDAIKPVLFGTMRVMRENAEHRQAFTSAVKREHDAIVDAIAAGDPEGARRAVLSHFIASETRVRASDPGIWASGPPIESMISR
jgi:GntR family transcriptional repressor for pyruvate dehydrogenase complex